MKVLFLVHAHPELQAGGTEIFSRDLFRTIRDRGIEGVYLAGTASHQRSTNPGTPFQTASGSNDELLIWSGGFDPFFFSQIDHYGVGPAFAALVRQLQPDIVHVHHLMVLGSELVGVIRRCAPSARIIMTLHDYYPICANDGQMMTTAGALCEAMTQEGCRRCFPERSPIDIKLRDLKMRHALALVDRFIAPSRFLRDRFVAWGLAADRISIIPNGLPARQPAPARAVSRRDHFGFFGHINRFKGATIALEASAILSRQGVDHQLSVFGSTLYQSAETIERFNAARADASSVRYYGRYDRTEIPRLLADVDWVVFPSEWWENAPLVISEAFQHWRPVIASNIGGSAELVKHGIDGLHFPVSNARSLAETMMRAISEPGLWQQLVDGIEAPTTIERCADSYLAVYQALCAPVVAEAA